MAYATPVETSAAVAFDEALEEFEVCRRNDPARALARIPEMLALAEQTGDDARAARVVVAHGHLLYHRAEYLRAEELFERTIRIARAVGERAIETEALLGIAFIRNSTGENIEATRLLGDVIDVASELGLRRLEGFARNTLGNVLADVSDTAGALAQLNAALELFREIDEPYGQLHALNNLGAMYLVLDDPASSLAELEPAEALAEELGGLLLRISTLVNAATALGRLGRTDEARERCARALDLCRNAGSPMHEAYIMMSLGALAGDDLGEALGCFEAAQAIASTTGDAMQWTAQGMLAEVHVRLGRIDEGIAGLLDAVEQVAAHGDASYLPQFHRSIADAYEAKGDAAGALRHRRLEVAAEAQLAGAAAQRQAMQFRMRQEMARALAERDRVARQTEELAARVASATGEVVEASGALGRRRAFVADLRREVDEIARSAGDEAATKVGEIAGRLERGLDDDASWQGFTAGFEQVDAGFLRALTSRWPALTRMEIRVCVLMRLELSTNEIATLLFSSPRTIHGHRFNVRRKLALGRDQDLAGFLATVE